MEPSTTFIARDNDRQPSFLSASERRAFGQFSSNGGWDASTLSRPADYIAR